MALEPVRLGSAVETALAIAAPQAEAAAADLSADLGETADRLLLADAERLGEVLTNLIDNALNHIGPAGQVRIEARDADGGVAIAVRDDGDGIAAAHLPYVFDRFYRADTARDRQRGGSGIGLAIVKAVTAAHGGTVTAASDGTGQGAVFTVWLPVLPSQPTR
jgi:signal transduction histidine kinase